MKLIGIDFGSKRVGVAISDDGGSLAFPLKIIPNDKNLVQNLAFLCKENKVTGLVLGHSKNFLGEDNPIMDDAKNFINDLVKIVNLEVFYHPEILSSKEAMHAPDNNEYRDDSAAAIVLQSYLDSIRPKKS